jgi:DNA invertase Pin-like site-specific DNA recombinase
VTMRPDATEIRLVYGYIHAEEPDEIEISLLRTEMAAYCQKNGYRLANVCCDRGSDGTKWDRAGFTAALDALALPPSYGLLVPALAHLSTDDVVRHELMHLVRRTGAKLLVLHDEQSAEGVS